MNFRPIAALGLLTVTVAGPVALHAQGPNPNNPYIQSISYGGTGCAQGSVGQSVSNDRLRFTLIFDNYVASTGPGVPATEGRKNCQIAINVKVPNGSGEYCARLDYAGYVGLPAGSSAKAGASYNEHELPDGQVVSMGGNEETFTGPAYNDYLRRDAVSLAWSGSDPVVTPLTVKSHVSIASGAPSQITTDSIEGRLDLGACEVPDTTAPAIAIAAPVAGGLYGLHATVPASFTCTDDGSGVASCEGRATLDTSTVGAHSFVVTATDVAGNVSTETVNYFVGGKNECKGGGHSGFLAPTFKNQGQCVSSFVK